MNIKNDSRRDRGGHDESSTEKFNGINQIIGGNYSLKFKKSKRGKIEGEQLINYQFEMKNIMNSSLLSSSNK